MNYGKKTLVLFIYRNSKSSMSNAYMPICSSRRLNIYIYYLSFKNSGEGDGERPICPPPLNNKKNASFSFVLVIIYCVFPPLPNLRPLNKWTKCPNKKGYGSSARSISFIQKEKSNSKSKIVPNHKTLWTQCSYYG